MIQEKENYSLIKQSISIYQSTCEDSQLLHLAMVCNPTSETARNKHGRITYRSTIREMSAISQTKMQ